MRSWRKSSGWVLAAVAVLSQPRAAGAQLMVMAPSDEPRAIEHAELAYAFGAGPPATWLSLRVQRGPVAVVAALEAGARASRAADAWFAALEETASPRLRPPRGRADCGGAPALVPAAWPRGSGAPASELTVDTAADVQALLEEHGLPPVSPLPDAPGYVVWLWPSVERVVTTRTLRVEGGSAPLALSAELEFPVLLSAVTRGAASYRDEVPSSELDVTFLAGRRRNGSDYRERLGAFLRDAVLPVLESRARGLLFDWSIYEDALSVAPLVRSYAHRAAGELPELDADACSDALRELRSDGAAPTTACGAALDAGLALGAAEPELAVLQRLALSSRPGVSPLLLQGGGEPSAPLLHARALDSECESAPPPPIVLQPSPPSGRLGSPAPAPAPEVVVEETYVVERETVEVHCGGSPEPEPYYGSDGDCSSDSSSSSDSSDSLDCSGDTSSSSGASDQADCGGDTSSSSSSSDDGCSGDTSTSSETGGYDGETCTGSAAPRAAPTSASQASLGRSRSGAGGRPRRLKASLWSVAFAAAALPIRRRKRGAGAAG